MCSQGESTKSLVFSYGTITPLTVVQSLHTMSKIEKIEIRADSTNANEYIELVCKAIDS